MKSFFPKLMALTAMVALAGCSSNVTEESTMKLVTSVDFSQVKIQDAFWSPRLEKHASTTLKVCIDQIENQTGRIRNFENAARAKASIPEYS